MGARFILFALCLGFAWALQSSTRRPVEPFQQPTPQVHLINYVGGRPSSLNIVPSIVSEDSHVIALNLAELALGYPVSYAVKDSYLSHHGLIRHVYLKQTAADGKEIFNADLNINVRNKRALNVGHSFYRGSTAAVGGHLSSVDALKSLLGLLNINTTDLDLVVINSEGPSSTDQAHQIEGVKGSVSAANVRAGYLQMDNGMRLEPVWDIQLDMDISWWNAFVSSQTGQVLSLYDWVSDLNTYNIYPIGVNDPDDGNRTIVEDPAITPPSPLGWHDQGLGTVYQTTIGNNVYAQINPTGGTPFLNNPRPNGTNTHDFDFPIDLTLQPVAYNNASTANLFAWNNLIHDIFYGYGFDEVAGNFQENNFGRGGLGGDAVQANCQDGGGTNNANFGTPVDGQRPRMRMYIWTRSNPYRDGDLEDGIIMHEYAHGISNRLTGGPQNVNCLGTAEAGGMGEGWGDNYATILRQRESYTRDDVFPMGAYSANLPNGIRMYPYTTDMTINPETYAYINLPAYVGVHAKGEVWCGILWEVYWNLIDIEGFDENVYSSGTGGNNVMLATITLGMKLQPCNPNFVSARDAILLADEQLYGGIHTCAMWIGFAKRGLGVNAAGGSIPVKEDFTIPAQCM